jgi:hypothetical protein
VDIFVNKAADSVQSFLTDNLRDFSRATWNKRKILYIQHVAAFFWTGFSKAGASA